MMTALRTRFARKPYPAIFALLGFSLCHAAQRMRPTRGIRNPSMNQTTLPSSCYMGFC